MKIQVLLLKAIMIYSKDFPYDSRSSQTLEIFNEIFNGDFPKQNQIFSNTYCYFRISSTKLKLVLGNPPNTAISIHLNLAEDKKSTQSTSMCNKVRLDRYYCQTPRYVFRLGVDFVLHLSQEEQEEEEEPPTKIYQMGVY